MFGPEFHSRGKTLLSFLKTAFLLVDLSLVVTQPRRKERGSKFYIGKNDAGVCSDSHSQ